MGNMYSNFSEVNSKPEDEKQMSVTPVRPTGYENNLNPKIAALVDPRSPSEGLSRTPLEIEERNRRIERTRLKNQFNKENNLSLPKSQLFTPDKEGVSTPTAPNGREFPLGFDPRSPNAEISRTPIALSTKVPAKELEHSFHDFERRVE